MPFHLPFNFPFYWKPNYRYTYNNHSNTQKSDSIEKDEKNIQESNPNQFPCKEDSIKRDNTHCEESSEYFFEIFGLKLYFDDILIICLLYFLYSEGVQDQELFICLILLLLS